MHRKLQRLHLGFSDIVFVFIVLSRPNKEAHRFSLVHFRKECLFENSPLRRCIVPDPVTLELAGAVYVRRLKLVLLPARRRPQGIVIIGVCLSVCVCVCLSVCLCASARYLKNGFMDHHQIWWVGAGGEPLDKVWFWCWSDSGCVSRLTFPFPLTLRDRAFCDI